MVSKFWFQLQFLDPTRCETACIGKESSILLENLTSPRFARSPIDKMCALLPKRGIEQT